MKLNLKPPGSELLKLNCDDLLPNVAFNFNLRRNSKTREVEEARAAADKVGWCRLTLSNTR